MKLTYFISIFYITLCLPTQLFTALSNPTAQNTTEHIEFKHPILDIEALETAIATEHKKRLNAEFKQSILDIQALETAIMTQDHRQFDQIISQKREIVSYKNPQENSDSVLHLAARIGNTHAVQKLLDFNFNPKRTNKLGQTALHLAYRDNPNLESNYNPKIIKYLVKKNKSLLNQVDTFKGTALHYAVIRNDPQAVQELISSSPELCLEDRATLTPLEWATKKFNPYTNSLEHSKSIQIIKILTEKDPNLNQKIKSAIFDILEIHESFISEKPQEIQKKLEKYLFDSIEQKSSCLLYLVLALINPNIHNNLSPFNGSTPLRWAYYNNQLKAFRILVNNNADINKIMNHRNFLMLACQDNNLNMVEELFSLNADPNIQNRYGDTALTIAIWQRNPNIIKKLCKNNADPNIQNRDGYTALMLAAYINSLDIVKELCKNNADPNKQNKDGQTALMMAISIWGGNPNIIKELCNYNANPNIRDKNGKTALDLAKEKFSNHTQIIRILEQAGYSTHPNIQKDDIIIADDLIRPCGDGNVNRVKEIVNKNWFNNKTHPALDLAKAILSVYNQIIIILEEAECNAKT